MRKKLLFCDIGDGMGDTMRRTMRPYFIDIETCPSTFEHIDEALRKEHFDAMAFAVCDDIEENCDFIRKIKSEYPDMLIYAIVTYNDRSLIRNLNETDLKRIFLMPTSAREICSTLAEDISSCGEGLIMDVVAKFLEEMHYAAYMHGFRFLCLAIERCFSDPNVMNDPENLIYPYIAEKMLTTPEFVDKEIAQLQYGVIHKNRIYEELAGDGTELSSIEVIAISVDEFLNFMVAN